MTELNLQVARDLRDKKNGEQAPRPRAPGRSARQPAHFTCLDCARPVEKQRLDSRCNSSGVRASPCGSHEARASREGAAFAVPVQGRLDRRCAVHGGDNKRRKRQEQVPGHARRNQRAGARTRVEPIQDYRRERMQRGRRERGATPVAAPIPATGVAAVCLPLYVVPVERGGI